jgi:hypothetical protein
MPILIPLIYTHTTYTYTTYTYIYLSIYLSIYRYNMEGVWDWKLGKFRQKFANVRFLVALYSKHTRTLTLANLHV